jgi:hypothetical protein
METESNGTSPLLDVLATKMEIMLAIHDCKKSAHIRRYRQFDSTHTPHIKGGVVRILVRTVRTIVQERQGELDELYVGLPAV